MLTRDDRRIRPRAVAFGLATGIALMLAMRPQAASADGESPDLVKAQIGVQDIVRYRQIFELQSQGDWKKADRIVRDLDDRLLVGRVLFQRYMHPTKYRSTYQELYDWMKAYADQPGAKRIYRLALSRQPKGYKSPRRPSVATSPRIEAVPDTSYRPSRKRSAKERRWVRNIRYGIAKQIRRGNPRGAESRLNRKETRRHLDSNEFDEMRRRVAAAYFFKGADKRALDLASRAAERSRRHVPLADWTAGLAAWRLGHFETARTHFEALARSPSSSGWNVAAGAFWAARANLITERPANVNPMLELAAAHSSTFYGLIAARLLGRDIVFNWTAPPLEDSMMANLRQSAAIKRAIALRQIDQTYWAEREFAVAYAKAPPTQHLPLLGLANRLGLARAQLTVGRRIADAGNRVYDSAKYPLPAYRQGQWFGIDRALVYAFIRQESEFDSRAKSPRGARGLMQLMPRTASAMARDRNLHRRDRWRLFSPELNIELGQKYLAHLIELKEVQGNLFLMAVAYNGGPGNLRKWRRRTNHQDDPLLFIESLPSLETRLFVERVLANFWIYRERLGQDTPSLDAIAAGNWPYYFALDVKGVRVARNSAFDAD